VKAIVCKYFWRCVPCETTFEDTRRLCYAWEDGFRCPRCGGKCIRDHNATRLANVSNERRQTPPERKT